MNNNNFAQKYHIQPKYGFINDPNGLVEFNNKLHIFFQYHPNYDDMHDCRWYHLATNDFVNYDDYQNAIYPDTKYDASGAYSGSAIVKDNLMHLFYTGNVLLKGNYDYIQKGRLSNTILITSEDGKTFSNKKVILSNKDYPNDISNHIRDPKVYKNNNQYELVLGARTKDNIGVALIYQSSDLNNFTYKERITSKINLGYMWECPDILLIEDKKILSFSPQGLKNEKYRFQNIYQSGYSIIDKNNQIDNFTEYDYGFDFYAPQTTMYDNKLILLAWMGLPDSPYEKRLEATNCLTIPRELYYEDSRIKQRPFTKLSNLRKNKQDFKLNEGSTVTINKTSEINITFIDTIKFNIRGLEITYNNDHYIFKFNKNGDNRNIRYLKANKVKEMIIYSDVMSLEIFIDGYTFTTQIFDVDDAYIQTDSNIKLTIYDLKEKN